MQCWWTAWGCKVEVAIPLALHPPQKCRSLIWFHHLPSAPDFREQHVTQLRVSKQDVQSKHLLSKAFPVSLSRFL